MRCDSMRWYKETHLAILSFLAKITPGFKGEKTSSAVLSFCAVFCFVSFFSLETQYSIRRTFILVALALSFVVRKHSVCQRFTTS